MAGVRNYDTRALCRELLSVVVASSGHGAEHAGGVDGAAGAPLKGMAHQL
jgi:hypothetical protein